MSESKAEAPGKTTVRAVNQFEAVPADRREYFTSLKVEWDAVDGATSYVVDVAEEAWLAAFAWTPHTVAAPATSFSIPNLKHYSPYAVRVSAVNEAGTTEGDIARNLLTMTGEQAEVVLREHGAELEAEGAKLREEATASQSDLEKRRVAELAAIREEIVRLTAQLDSVEAERDALKESSASASQSTSALEEELAAIRGAMAAKTAELNAAVAAAQAETADAVKRAEAAEAAAASASTDAQAAAEEKVSATLKETLKSELRLEEANGQLTAQVGALSAQVKDLEPALAAAHAELEAVKAEAAAAAQAAQADAATVGTSLATTHAELKASNDARAELEAELRGLREHATKCAADLDVSETKLKALAAHADAQEAAAAAHTSEIAGLRRQVEDMRKELASGASTSSQVADLQTEVFALRAGLEERTRAHEASSAELAKARATKSAMEAAAGKHADTVRHLEQCNARLEEELAKMSATMTTREEREARDHFRAALPPTRLEEFMGHFRYLKGMGFDSAKAMAAVVKHPDSRDMQATYCITSA